MEGNKEKYAQDLIQEINHYKFIIEQINEMYGPHPGRFDWEAQEELNDTWQKLRTNEQILNEMKDARNETIVRLVRHRQQSRKSQFNLTEKEHSAKKRKQKSEILDTKRIKTHNT